MWSKVWAIAFETLAASAIFFTLTAPPGFVALRLLRVEAPPLARLALAIGVGTVVTLCVLVLVLGFGLRGLILPFATGSLLWLRPGRPPASSARAIAPELASAIVLGAIALLANASDVVLNPDGLSVRVGFDVSDRAFYGRVSQELERAPIWAIENPGFAPLPLQYSYLPSLAGVLLHRYALADALAAFGTCLPVIGLVFTAIAAAALVEALGASSLLSRALTMVLLAFGGDLSFLVPRVNGSWLERTRHFFVFYSFSSEPLFYNPWMLGLPVMLTALLCLVLLTRAPGRSLLLPAAVLLAALFQTKVFAFIPLWLAVAVRGAFGDRRLLLVAALALVLAAPGMALVAGSGAARDGAPLLVDPLAFIHEALSSNPSLATLADSVGVPLAGLVVLLGGFGFRLLGIPPLLNAARRGSEGARICALAALLSVTMALTFVGNPTRQDGVQFMLLPLSLLWVFAAPTLSVRLERPGLNRLVAALIVTLSVLTPIRYLASKGAPELFTSEEALDRRRFQLSRSTTEACAWLRAHSLETARLVLPLEGDPENRGGLKPGYVGLLSSRRLVAQAVPFSVSAPLAAERQAAVRRLYETADAAEGESILLRLGASWVWEESARPLRFHSPRLVPRAVFGGTTLLSYDRP